MEENNEPTFGEAKAHISEKQAFDISVSGAADIEVTRTVTIRPDRLVFSFQRHYVDGEPRPAWDNPWPRVSGPRRLADGSVSKKSTHDRTYYGVRDAPQWIIDQIEKHRPKN